MSTQERPGSYERTPEIRNKNRIAMVNWHNTHVGVQSEKVKRWWESHPEARVRGKWPKDRVEKMRRALIGKKQSPESNRKRSETLKGRIFTLEHRRKISASMMGKLAGRTLTEEHKQKVRMNASRYWLGKHRSEETKEKLSLVRSKQIIPDKDTSIERAVQEYLKDKNVPFEKHVPFRMPNNRHHTVDIYLSNAKLVIECDGTYWHSRPGVREKDHYFDQSFSNMGYQVLRLPEEEISNGSFKFKIDRVLGE